MKWSNRNPEWERSQKEKYGWGGTDSIWTGKFILVVIIVVLAGIGIDLAVMKVLFGWR